MVRHTCVPPAPIRCATTSGLSKKKFFDILGRDFDSDGGYLERQSIWALSPVTPFHSLGSV